MQRDTSSRKVENWCLSAAILGQRTSRGEPLYKPPLRVFAARAWLTPTMLGPDTS